MNAGKWCIIDGTQQSRNSRISVSPWVSEDLEGDVVIPVEEDGYKVGVDLDVDTDAIKCVAWVAFLVVCVFSVRPVDSSGVFGSSATSSLSAIIRGFLGVYFHRE